MGGDENGGLAVCPAGQVAPNMPIGGNEGVVAGNVGAGLAEMVHGGGVIGYSLLVTRYWLL